MAADLVKCFNIDFNWDFLGRPASPGLYTFADPVEHADYYEALGANVAMLNTVSFNGYAWYPSDIVPVTPGPGREFTVKTAEEMNRRGLAAIGYFTQGYNPEWDRRHPEQTHSEVPNVVYKTTLSEEYIDYCAAHTKEMLDRVPVTGFMIDWIHAPTRGRFLDCEKEDYVRLMGEPWPECDELSDEATAAFDRALLDRAWTRIREAAKSTRDCVIFTNHPFEKPDDPLWNGSPILREADWMLNEAPGTEMLDWLTRESEGRALVLQNIVGWYSHDTEKVMEGLDTSKYGLFGFVQADPVSTLVAETGSKGSEVNARNMAAVQRAFQS